ncbi:MAG: amidohydrolase family protein [Acidimicrobiia bacterium]
MTRFLSDWLITMTAQPEVVARAAVDVNDGVVTWSGPAAEAPRTDGQSIELRGLVIPGLINTHAHTPMVLLRGAGEGLPVSRWLTEVMWPREGKLTPEDVELAMTLGAAELLGNGITTSHEMYFHPRAVANAASAAGLRCVVTPPILVAEDLARFGDWRAQIEAMVEEARHWQDHALISVGFGPHSAYAVAEEALRRVAELAAKHGMHVQIHLAEAEHEGDGVSASTGMSVTAYLAHIGILDSPVVAAHSVWLSDQDLEILAAHRASVAHCPSSNGKHASGIARVTEMRKAGIRVGLGTDGPASHDRLDLFEDMRGALHLARLRAADAGALGPMDVLQMATREGALALGRDDLGHLGAGAKADMVLLDVDPLVPMTEDRDLITHLVYSGHPGLIRGVWVGGRRVVDETGILTVDLPAARSEITERARALATT